MRRKRIYRRSERLKIANAAQTMLEGFVAVGTRGDRGPRDLSGGEQTQTSTFQTNVGKLDVSVDVSEGMCHFFVCFDNPAYAGPRLTYRNWHGKLNAHSGKWNDWVTADMSAEPLGRETGALHMIADMRATLLELAVDLKPVEVVA